MSANHGWQRQKCFHIKVNDRDKLRALLSSQKGPFTNDVSKEGEGGGWPISDERRGGCVDLVLTRGREGVKNPENLADVICERPPSQHNCTTIETRWKCHSKPLAPMT